MNDSKPLIRLPDRRSLEWKLSRISLWLAGGSVLAIVIALFAILLIGLWAEAESTSLGRALIAMAVTNVVVIADILLVAVATVGGVSLAVTGIAVALSSQRSTSKTQSVVALAAHAGVVLFGLVLLVLVNSYTPYLRWEMMGRKF